MHIEALYKDKYEVVILQFLGIDEGEPRAVFIEKETGALKCGKLSELKVPTKQEAKSVTATASRTGR